MAMGAVLIATAPAAAAPILWDKVEADMPFERVKELYPEGHVFSGKGLARPMISFDRKLDGCDAYVYINIDRKVAEAGAKVESVVLSGQKCDSKMFSQLLGKYGPPMALNNDNDEEKKTARWVADGRSITYKRQGGGSWASDSWEITYAPIKDVGL
jgi:hypothetical protein